MQKTNDQMLNIFSAVVKIFWLLIISSSIISGVSAKEKRQELPLPDLSQIHAEMGAADLDSAGLDNFINDYMSLHHIPGLQAVILKDTSIIYSQNFGNAYFQPNILVSDSTLFMLASISKTVTATALMQLYDQGYFGLDDPVNDYLPFQVNHPRYPDIPITFRMLLTHTSGMRDNWAVMGYYPGDSPIPLGEYLENYCVPGGQYYYPNLNFTPWAPGEQFEYCNNGAALIGYLVEVISGQDFSQYCLSNLFPLVDMYESSYRFADLDSMRIAQPMFWNGNTYSSYPHFGYSDYPSGSLRTSAIQLSRFLSSYMRAGQYGGNTVLDSATVAEMLTLQIPEIEPTQGLIWYTINFGGRQIWGHGGGDLGVTTEMYFCPDQNTGVVLLTNGESFFYEILDACFDFAQSYGVSASLTMTPQSTPIIIPASGGNFLFDVNVVNTDNTAIYFDFWIDVTLPDSTIVGPLILKPGIILPEGQSILREDLNQVVPANAPAGQYFYTAYIGQYPGNAQASDQFEFTKTETSDLSSYTLEWSLSGWDEMLTNQFRSTPESIELSVYPNPFNNTAKISYSLSAAGPVNISIYNLAGRRVQYQETAQMPAGRHSLTFDGSSLSTGIYLLKVQSGQNTASDKLLLLK